jgi:hypothetical protein
MIVTFNNGCVEILHDTIKVTQFQAPEVPITHDYLYETADEQIIEAQIGENCKAIWTSYTMQEKPITSNGSQFLVNRDTIGEYVYPVYSLDTLYGCISEYSFVTLKVVSPNSPSISGTVSANGVVVGSAAVQLFKKVGSEFIPQAMTEINRSGEFTFKYLEPATYIVRAVPNVDFSTTSPIYLPSYYFSTTNWNEAFQINLQGIAQGVDITLIEYLPLSVGNGEIAGNVFNSDSSLGYNNPYKAFVHFQVPIYVVQNGVIVSYALTDADGNYSVPNLPDGNYQVYAELPGYNKLVQSVTILNGSKAEVNFVVKNGTVALGIDDLLESQITMYPNPTQDKVVITCNEKVESVEITDITGRSLKTIFGETSIDVSNLKTGVYIVNIKTAMGVTSKNLVKE